MSWGINLLAARETEMSVSSAKSRNTALKPLPIAMIAQGVRHVAQWAFEAKGLGLSDHRQQRSLGACMRRVLGGESHESPDHPKFYHPKISQGSTRPNHKRPRNGSQNGGIKTIQPYINLRVFVASLFCQAYEHLANVDAATTSRACCLLHHRSHGAPTPAYNAPHA